MVIKPTVGRVVWFRFQPDLSPLAAIVAHVWSDSCVNLAIFGQDGVPMSNPPTSVRLIQEGETPPVGCCYCEWMPYQIGQAKKHEAGS